MCGVSVQCSSAPREFPPRAEVEFNLSELLVLIVVVTTDDMESGNGSRITCKVRSLRTYIVFSHKEGIAGMIIIAPNYI